LNLSFFIALTEAEVRKEFAEEDERRLSDGEVSQHATSASAFVLLGIELKDLQCIFSSISGLDFCKFML